MVVWIVGLSGSGKTFLAKKIIKKIKGKKIHIDGDEIRKFITKNLKYTIQDRRKNSSIIRNLCKYLETKGFFVICSILSIFKDHQKKNRKEFKNYFQIWIKANKLKLFERNNKKIYSKKNVIGKDIDFPKPYKSDLIIENTYKKYEKKKLEDIVNKIYHAKKNKKKN